MTEWNGEAGHSVILNLHCIFLNSCAAAETRGRGSWYNRAALFEIVNAAPKVAPDAMHWDCRSATQTRAYDRAAPRAEFVPSLYGAQICLGHSNGTKAFSVSGLMYLFALKKDGGRKNC